MPAENIGSDSVVSCDDIVAVSGVWRGKWAVLRGTEQTPAERGQKIEDLNRIARHLAHLASSRPLDLDEIKAVTVVEMEILKDELHWPKLGQAL